MSTTRNSSPPREEAGAPSENAAAPKVSLPTVAENPPKEKEGQGGEISDPDSEIAFNMNREDSSSDEERSKSFSSNDIRSRNHTVAGRVANDVSRLMVKYKCESLKELVQYLRSYRREIDKQYLLNLEQMALVSSGALDRETDGGERENSIRSTPVVSLLKSEHSSDVTSIFSFRQLASWRLAMQRIRDSSRESDIERRLTLYEESIFSDIPPPRDDHAETNLEADAFTTEKQRSHNTMIRYHLHYELRINIVVALAQVFLFLALSQRVCFEIPYTSASYAIEFLLADFPLFLYSLKRAVDIEETKGILRVNWVEAAKNYFKSGSAILDILGIFPLEAVGRGLGGYCTLATNNCGFVAPHWRLNKFLLCRGFPAMLSDVLDAISFEIGFHPSIGRLIQSFVNLFLVAHIASALMNIFLLSDDSLVYSWLGDIRYPGRSILSKYLILFDWSTKSIVGFSTRIPFGLPDLVTVFVLVVSFFGIYFFTVLVACLSNFLQKPGAWNTVSRLVDELSDECEHRNLPSQFKQEGLDFLWHMYETARHSESAHTELGDLPKSLQIQILSHIGAETLRRVPLLAPESTNRDFALCIAIALEGMVIPPYTILFRQGDKGDSMAFITYGSMAVVTPDYEKTHDPKCVRFVLKTGSFFGEIALILGVRRTAAVGSMGHYTNLLVLKKDMFRQISLDFPSAIRRMTLEAEARKAALEGGTGALRKARVDKLLESTIQTTLRRFFRSWMHHLQSSKEEKEAQRSLLKPEAKHRRKSKRSLLDPASVSPPAHGDSPTTTSLVRHRMSQAQIQTTLDTGPAVLPGLVVGEVDNEEADFRQRPLKVGSSLSSSNKPEVVYAPSGKVSPPH